MPAKRPTSVATTDFEATLLESRRHPHPAAPASNGNEPDDARRQIWTWAEAAARHQQNLPDDAHRVTDVAGQRGRWPTVLHLLDAYREGTTTPSDYVAQLRDRWAAPGSIPEAIVHVVSGCEAAVEESDRRWRLHRPRPLEGIPFGVKDLIDVADARVTCGSRQTNERVATADATAVARLRAAGAIPIAITATTEYGCGDPHNSRYGPVRNPWNVSCWSGGSSAGSAAALASGMLPLAFGTDTGGSIRIPAAFCGVSGIKPTYGRVPRTGVASLSWSLDHVGPLARSVDDLTLALGVIGGPDGIDPTAAPSQVPVADLGEINGLRIGVPTQWFFDEVDSEVHRCFKDATAVLEDLGARFVPVDLGAIEPIHREAWILFYCELASNQEERRHLRDGFDEGTLARLDCGFVPSAVDYLRVLRRRPVVQRAFREAMDALDLGLLMTPGPGAASPSLRDLTQSVNGTPLHFHRVTPRNMRIFDYTGMPALSLPAGFAQGMPCAVQLAGRHWDDGLVLAVGSAFQRATRFHLASPGD